MIPLPFKTDLALLAPELFLAGMALLLILVGAFYGDRSARLIHVIAILGLFTCALELASEAKLWSATLAFHGMFSTDMFALTFKVLCLTGAAFALMISVPPLRAQNMMRFEYPVLVTLSVLGMMLMISAHSFLTLYMGLELSSLALYVLAAFRRDNVLSAEAGMKYFILGALASGMLLFGISLVYGFSGTLDFQGVATGLAAHAPAHHGVTIGMVFILVALVFKLSGVPFHMWTPDVYQGAPTPVTAFFAMVPKMAAFAVLLQLLFGPFAALRDSWAPIILFVAVASMIWGAVAAVVQTNIKRLIAYAAITNIGYALLGVVAGTAAGISASILFLGIYLIMTAGFFAAVLSIQTESGDEVQDIQDLAGLSRTHPLVAYLLVVMLFAMAGIPPLAGFFGKFVVFQSLVQAGYYGVAVLGVVASVVAAYYYLKIIRTMFFDAPVGITQLRIDGGQQLVALAAVLFVLVFILASQPFYHLATQAAQVIVPATPLNP